MQTGFARTGTMFACEQFGIVPDLIVTAKGIAGGLPLSAVTGRAEIMDAPAGRRPRRHLRRQPARLRRGARRDRDLRDTRASPSAPGEIGDILFEKLGALRDADPRVAEVRGRGAMVAIELVDPATGEPDAALTAAVAAAAHAAGVILLTCGTYGNVIRFLPPLSIPDHLLIEGLDVVAEAVAERMSIVEQTRAEPLSHRADRTASGAARPRPRRPVHRRALARPGSADPIEVSDPATGRVIKRIANARPEDGIRALDAAVAAADAWAATAAAHARRDPAPRVRPAAGAPRRLRAADDARDGQAARRGERRGHLRRRVPALVQRGGGAHLRPLRRRTRRAPGRMIVSQRPVGPVLPDHAVELPARDGDPQDRARRSPPAARSSSSPPSSRR